MRVTVIPIVCGALRTVANQLERGMEHLEISGRIETIQITALVRSARIPRRVLDTRGELLSIELQ